MPLDLMQTLEAFNLVHFWALVLAFAILIYGLLDGFDLGVGILFGFNADPVQRDQMMQTIEPVWDGNETWLVVVGTVLFAAFPAAYAIFLSAFYLPVVILLGALILRGVSMEFRGRSGRLRGLWSGCFSGGSLVATFVQGTAIGALVEGIDISNGEYAGGAWDWLSPFALLGGFGLVAGYALLGAGWLVLKTRGGVREWSYRWLPRLMVLTVACVLASFIWTLMGSMNISHRWADSPVWVMVPLVLVVLGAGGIALSVRQRRDRLAYPMAALIFIAAFCAFIFSFWPWILPGDLRFDQAAAPPASLQFLFYGAGLVVLPVVLIYTVGVYWIFRGKSRPIDP
ncbi:cytochrome d ubiquinol oxidase subunit II [Spiribacter roseus]|uniref:Cytochrome d ubiquinol oxidase subunit II n=1 Tax=Spiribacter roseus TaxID=1855875 RepID=A0ABV3RXL9_9GAMM